MSERPICGSPSYSDDDEPCTRPLGHIGACCHPDRHRATPEPSAAAQPSAPEGERIHIGTLEVGVPVPPRTQTGPPAPEGGDDVEAALAGADHCRRINAPHDEVAFLRRAVASLRRDLDEARSTTGVELWAQLAAEMETNRRLREALEEAEAGLEFAVAQNPSSWKQSTDRQALRIVRAALSSTESEASDER